MSSNESKENGFTIDFSNEDKGWSNDICGLLTNYEYNCSTLATGYKNSYLELIDLTKWFRVPLIFLSSANSVISVGLQAYMGQTMVSTLTCLISFLCGLISSVELYLQIQRRIEAQILSYRSFYLLSLKVANVMKLHPQNRHCDPVKFLEEIELEYKELFLNSNVLASKLKDRLLTVDKPRPVLNQLLSFSRSP
jgi:hypothetical protein